LPETSPGMTEMNCSGNVQSSIDRLGGFAAANGDEAGERRAEQGKAGGLRHLLDEHAEILEVVVCYWRFENSSTGRRK
jgi:hypothetical protein